MNFTPIRTRRVFEEVIDQFREQMRNGQLKPGDKLPSERELARQFQASRNAVREALRTLEVAGFIELQTGARGGAFCREVDARLVADSMRDMLHLGQLTIEHLTQARQWIETVVVRIACQRATDEDFAALEENIELGVELLRQGRLAEKVVVNVEFHNILAEATKNPVLILNMRLLMDLTMHFARHAQPDVDPYHIEWRRKMVALLRARDEAGAIRALEERLLRLQERYHALAAQQARAQSSAGNLARRRLAAN
ncbi:MAG: FadR/GntR family transcriptional regulator [Reyranellaceae bacterium]